MQLALLLCTLLFLGAGCGATTVSDYSSEINEEKIAHVIESVEVVELEDNAEQDKEEKEEEQEEKVTENIFLHDTESFSLVLPSDFNAEVFSSSEIISPKTKNEFPSILVYWFGGKKDSTTKEMLEFEMAHLHNLCLETDACGTIINSREITVSGRTAVEYTVQVPGRAQDDKGGYIMRYHYVVPIVRMEHDPAKYPKDTKKYPFWYLANFVVSASDIEKPENIKKQFDAIMTTIKLKN